MIFSFLGLALTSATFIFLALLSHLNIEESSPPFLVPLSLLIFCHYTGLSTTMWLLLIELSPVHHIFWVLPLSSATLWSSCLVQVMIFPLIMEFRPLSVSLLSWVGAGAGAAAYATLLWFVPDTKKKPLGSMELHFKDLFQSEQGSEYKL